MLSCARSLCSGWVSHVSPGKKQEASIMNILSDRPLFIIRDGGRECACRGEDVLP